MKVDKEILSQTSSPEDALFKRHAELDLMPQSLLWEERGLRAGDLHCLIAADERAEQVHEPEVPEAWDVRQLTLSVGVSRTVVTLRSSKQDGPFGFSVILVMFVQDAVTDLEGGQMSPPERIIHGSTSTRRSEIRRPNANFHDTAEAIDDTLIIDALYQELLTE